MISKSPDRLTFQKECYIKRCAEEGKEPNPYYLSMYDNDVKRYDARFDTDESKTYNLEYDLLTTPWILDKVRTIDWYAQNLYAALCNREFTKADTWPLLKDQRWSCSWRYAGGIIADMQQKGDYIDWYCSGIRNDGYQDDLETVYPNQYVSEGFVTDEIRADLLSLGWFVLDEDSR